MTKNNKPYMAGIDLRLKIIRNYVAVKREEFAKLLSISESTYTAYEDKNNTRCISYKHLDVIIREYGINEEWLYHGEGSIAKNKDSNTYYLDIAYRVTWFVSLVKADIKKLAESLFLKESVIKELLINSRGTLKCVSVRNDRTISWGNNYLQDAFIDYFKFRPEWFFNGEGGITQSGEDDLYGVRARINRLYADASLVKGNEIYNCDILEELSMIYKKNPSVSLNWVITGKGTETISFYNRADELEKEWSLSLNNAMSNNLKTPILIDKEIVEVDANVLGREILSCDNGVKAKRNAYKWLRNRIVCFLEWNKLTELQIMLLLGIVDEDQFQKACSKLLNKQIEDYLRDAETGWLDCGVSDFDREKEMQRSDYKSFCEEITFKLKNEGLSNPLLAKALRINKNAVDIWRNTALPVKCSILAKMSKDNKMNLHWLFTGKLDPWLDSRGMIRPLGLLQ